MTAKSTTRAIATATGVSWMSVVISLFMLAFIFYIFAKGSAGVYYQLLFTTVSKPDVNTSYLGTSTQTTEQLKETGDQTANSDIENNPQAN